MNIQLEDCNLSQTILEFAQENTSTGKISLKLYGSHADNRTNGKERLPYIKSCTMDYATKAKTSSKRICLVPHW